MNSTSLQTIRLIAVDLDGPLLIDTFSPIMHKLCSEYYRIDYTRELERNTFSRSRAEVVDYLRRQIGEQMSETERKQSDEESIASYFRYRDEYMRDHPHGMKPEVPAFLDLLTSLGVTVICYGGLDEDYMRRGLGEQAERFATYICTNEFRPGVREIVRDFYKLAPHQALFIDDVNFVAEHAKMLGTPFIGVPSNEAWSWQKHDMKETGVRRIVDSVSQIDLALLQEIDAAAVHGGGW
ncbi:HAD family hydrolase [Burkholderia gladioli]|jgi:phosphoglycolate phosphatase-like HAD superfamily hydrolase|uniref:Haloacid dehalogenase-like hydrolase family protein n=1 Tax=Burkholderia gladioli TaxID=28095 RepID=A0AAW3F0V7_BURGA|nr:hypothetical protein [Burkholderia gladioli]AJW94612.1 haloacid dehalogenase-like hydrolase family protein [Burkholderia gladioli]ASD83913.1 hypothetical protein CEJ98_34425 [Burkholderia gladioli pv. gladioli]AWY51336.1 hypothetical protein A8H28_09190 [Burkholderia gladioli pv. gladioli]KGC13516.1 haloacid dehalogenase-like hydrolase family protein [Burkholderia gladioli]KKJ04036.1 hypothetical protein XF14_24020 [Burkholderia gladioli]